MKIAALLLLIAIAGCASRSSLTAGRYRAVLDSPGGDLTFGLSIERHGEHWHATVENGPERIPIPGVRVDGPRVALEFPHYDSRIDAVVVDGELRGQWRKRRGQDRISTLPFHARREALETGDVDSPFEGRWHVEFAKSEEPAVGEFRPSRGDRFHGTFLTTTGDYRYLSGHANRGTLTLSVFDGAHAFLFRAQQTGEGAITGDFWSSDSWHETWTAQRDPDATLPDAFAQTSWKDGVELKDLVFRDLDGRPVNLADPRFHGRARILQIFGTWCPNCHDAALYLSELHRRYAPHGLSVVGLAFELTDDFPRNVEQVKHYVERHGTEYPVLIAGPADKAEATKALTALDRVRSYPTTVFIDARGKVRRVHTGFTGPATGQAHDELRKQFESTIDELLRE